jgi:glycolate oxidase iron-sulfur subunit
MKNLKDYSEDIYKCTKCGFCQAACPIYKETGLETAVSRGKFTLLNGILHGKVAFSKKIGKYLDMCLGCRACYNFCPAGINAEEIITAARVENARINGISLFKRALILLFKSNFRLKMLGIALNIYKEIGLMAVLLAFTRFMGGIGKVINVFNAQLKENVQYSKLLPVSERSGLKIVYFPGCIGSYINPSAKNAVVMVLARNGYNVIIPDGLRCCGIMAKSAGDLDTFKELAAHNVRLIPDDADVILTDCASCGSAWHSYPDVLEGELKQKAETIAQKAININEFLNRIPLYIPVNTALNLSVTYHDPCHLSRFQNVTEEPRNILRKIPGIDYKEMDGADQCCGAAGSFCVAKPDISLAISKKKAHNILNTGADAVCTSCSACKIGLAQGMEVQNGLKPIMSPVELLAKLYLQESGE